MIYDLRFNQSFCEMISSLRSHHYDRQKGCPQSGPSSCVGAVFIFALTTFLNRFLALSSEFERLPSGHRFSPPKSRLNRKKYSFIPSSVRSLNGNASSSTLIPTYKQALLFYFGNFSSIYWHLFVHHVF